jgi:DNA-directed RNA polymerase II subunit RPB1
VIINDGELLTGMMDKKALGDGGGGLIHIIFNEDGWDRCRRFIGAVQFTTNLWLTTYGFSCGIGDTVADAATMDKITELIDRAKEDVREVIKKYQKNELEEKPGRCVLVCPSVPAQLPTPDRCPLFARCYFPRAADACERCRVLHSRTS